MEISANVVLALDIGLKRIGIAKAVQNIPICLTPILRKNRNQAANEVQRLVIESMAETLVVGFPTSNTHENFRGLEICDSKELENEAILTMQKRVLHFVNLLTLPPSIEVVFIDEAFSSKEALDRLDDKKIRKKAHKKSGILDSLAALVILERYLAKINGS